MSGGGLSTSRLRVEYAPACQLKGSLYVEAYRALDAVFAYFGYHPRQRDTGAMNCRKITGGSGYSLHSYGPGDVFTFHNGTKVTTSLAVDVDWQSNPYGRPPQPTNRPPGMNAAIRAVRTNTGEQLWRNGADYTGGNVDPMHNEIVCTKRGLLSGVNWNTVMGHKPQPDDPNAGRAFRPYSAANTDANIYALGGRNDQIAELQLLLNHLGFGAGKVDGKMAKVGPTTVALVAFKKAANWRDASGAPDRSSRVDEKVMQALRNLAAAKG